ncbi:hypothetical protein D3C86_2050730 [compost metagenome]
MTNKEATCPKAQQAYPLTQLSDFAYNRGQSHLDILLSVPIKPGPEPRKRRFPVPDKRRFLKRVMKGPLHASASYQAPYAFLQVRGEEGLG